MQVKVHQCSKMPGAVIAMSAACLLLSSCAGLEREYRLQSWEKNRISADKAIKKGQKRTGLKLAQESVAAAEGFGDSDFRLGVSLTCLGDAQEANQHDKEAETAYKRAVKVLFRAEKESGAHKPDVTKPGAEDNSQIPVLHGLIVEDLADSLSHLGELYLSEDRFMDAAKCFDKGTGYYQSLLDSKAMTTNDLILQQKYVQSVLGMARSSASADRYDDANQSYQKALKLAAYAGCSEYQVRDIRDEFLKYLQKIGKEQEAQALISDALFCQYTADGNLALSEGDYTAAEIAYRKALPEATKSTLSGRRMLRALFNLITVFSREGKVEEVVQCNRMVDNFVQTHLLESEKDYDQILDLLANYYLAMQNFEASRTALGKQLPYRMRQFGKQSREVCITYAMLGQDEFGMKHYQAAEAFGYKAYRLLKVHELDRSYFYAISITADLMNFLNRFSEAEELYKRLIDIKLTRLDEADPFIIGLRTNLLILYDKFKMHTQAAENVKHTIEVLSKGNPTQRAGAFPYIAVSLACCTHNNWWDLGEPLAQLGQNILRNDLSGVFPGDAIKSGWTKNIDLLQKHFNKSF